MAEYHPLEAYAVVGNLETCALVARDGSVDWLPVPHVEDPSAFAAILDAEEGGQFRIHPLGYDDHDRAYVAGTNVLRTTFDARDGTVAVTDFMPVADGRPIDRGLYRRVECTGGSAAVDLTFDPRFDYARAGTTLSVEGDRVLAAGDEGAAALSVPDGVDPELDDDGTAWGRLHLAAGEVGWFVLGYDAGAGVDPVGIDLPDRETCRERLSRTVEFWRDWSHSCPDDGDCPLDGPWHDLAVRSELALKLMVHHDPGTACAAPTTSLPETIGGVRNWDYRYNWLRDTAFTLQALSNLGHTAEARRYHDWLLEFYRDRDPADLQPLYGMHGEEHLPEVELDHLEGYRGSTPVRIGNGAAEQLQLDVYGEVVLGIYETVVEPEGPALPPEDWAVVRRIVDHVCEVWSRPDASIWEVRGGPRQFVFSKVMCWAALDRGLAMAESLDYPAPAATWRDHRERIRDEVLSLGYDPEVGSFVQSYDDTALDATALLIPAVGFLPFDDSRVESTIEAIRDRLVADDGLVRRYDGDDGLPGEEGAFCLCSCWLVDALALSGRPHEAVDQFTDLLSFVNDVGLLAEEVDPIGNVQLGNFPQAFSHIGIVNSALTLGRVFGHDGDGGDPMGVDLGIDLDLGSDPGLDAVLDPSVDGPGVED